MSSSLLDRPTVRIAPVSLAAPTMGSAGLAFSGNPAQVSLARDAVRLKFTRIQQDWVSFRQDWERYVRQLGGRETRTDRSLLSTSEMVLDEANQLNY